MNQWKRLLFYLIINVVVSAITTWIVLTIWDSAHQPSLSVETRNQNNQIVTTEFTGSNQPPTISPAANQPNLTKQERNLTQDVEEYQVEANDTLGEIATKYGLSVEDLMSFNGLTDPNAISVGMVIYIPVTPEAIESEQPTRIPAVSTKSGSLSPNQIGGGVVINGVIGVGDLSAERVFFSRTGSGVLPVAGWRLMDEDGNVFEFPNLELYEGGAVNVWTKSGSTTVVDLYWGLQYSVWQSGEMAVLVDANGNLKASFKIP